MEIYFRKLHVSRPYELYVHQLLYKQHCNTPPLLVKKKYIYIYIYIYIYSFPADKCQTQTKLHAVIFHISNEVRSYASPHGRQQAYLWVMIRQLTKSTKVLVSNLYFPNWRCSLTRSKICHLFWNPGVYVLLILCSLVYCVINQSWWFREKKKKLKLMNFWVKPTVRMSQLLQKKFWKGYVFFKLLKKAGKKDMLLKKRATSEWDMLLLEVGL
jgi:hypothetical protein